jgi:hypothetical protein
MIDPAMTGRERAFWVTFGALAVVSLCPLFASELVPGVDYSTHLSMIRILRLWFEDRARFHESYGTRLVQPYWGFYLPVLLLSAVMSIDLAGKVVLGAILVGIPVAVLRLCRREAIDPRVSFLAFPVIYSASYYWGFAPFLAGTTLALLSLPAVMRFAESGSTGDLARVCAWMMAIFCAHAVAFALWIGCAGWIVLAWRWPPRWPTLARFAAAVAVPLTLFLLWNRSVPVWGNLASARLHPGSASVYYRGVRFVHEAFTLPDKGMESAVAIAFTVASLLLLVGDYGRDQRARLVRWVPLAALAFLGYWFVPPDVFGLNVVYPRLLVFSMLFAIPCAAPRPQYANVVAALAVALTITTAAGHTLIARRYGLEMADLRRCLDQARPGTNLVGLIGTRKPKSGDQPLLLHADNYHTYWNLGRVFSHSMDMLPTTPVYYRAATPFGPGAPAGFDWIPEIFDYGKYAAQVHYFLVHDPDRIQIGQVGRLRPAEEVYFKRWQPSVKLVCRQGMWKLYENLPVTRGAPVTVTACDL